MRNEKKKLNKLSPLFVPTPLQKGHAMERLCILAFPLCPLDYSLNLKKTFFCNIFRCLSVASLDVPFVVNHLAYVKHLCDFHGSIGNLRCNFKNTCAYVFKTTDKLLNQNFTVNQTFQKLYKTI